MSILIKLPESLVISPFKVKLLLAVKLFEVGLITSGQGAEMLEISKQAFLELLGKHKVSIFQYDMTEIEADYKNA